MEYASANGIVEKEVRLLDRWVARIASWRRIKSALYVIAFFETTISPLLPELVVAAVLSYRKDISWKLLSVISALGSATGAAFLYVAGKFLYGRYTHFFNEALGSELGSYSEKLLEHNTFISIFFAAFTPLPDKVFAFLSGVFTLSFVTVCVAFFLGRLIRVGIVAYFSYEYGDEAREYILKHTKTATYVVIALMLAYVAYKILL